MRLIEPRPLLKQSKMPIQAELFSCHMKQDLIERFKDKKKEYRYVLRHIDKMDAQHRDVKRLRKLDASVMYEENGLVQIHVYRNGLSCNYKLKNF